MLGCGSEAKEQMRDARCLSGAGIEERVMVEFRGADQRSSLIFYVPSPFRSPFLGGRGTGLIWDGRLGEVTRSPPLSFIPMQKGINVCGVVVQSGV